MLRKLKLRMRAFIHRDDINDEMQSHLDQLADEFEQQGMPPEEARARARRQFGNLTQTHERSYEIFSFRMVDDLSRDLRFAWRSLRHNPSVAVAAVLSMGLAIGVNTAVFSLIQEIFYSQPTAPLADDLIMIRLGNSSHASLANLRDLDRSGALQSVAGFDIEKTVNWRDGDSVKQTPVMLVSENYFDLLATRPFLGRAFRSDEARAELNPHLVLITHRLWTRSLSQDPSIVGRALTLNGRPYTVLGVLPENFRPPTYLNTLPDLYIPTSPEVNASVLKRHSGTLMLLGRKKPEQTMEQARAALQVVVTRLASEYSNENKGIARTIQVRRFAGIEEFTDPDAAPLVAFSGVLLAAVFIVLSIACVNVSGVLVARAGARRREIATRLAIGAGRGRLVRQLLAEALLLSALGAAAGLMLHRYLISVLNNLTLPLPVPVVFEIRPDFTLLLYAVGLTVLCALIAGLVPALQATRQGLTPGLRMEEPQYGHRWLTFRNALLVVQVATTVALLSIALLFTRSLARVHSMNPGFDLQHTVLAHISVVGDRYSKDQLARFSLQALENAATAPGVRSAALARTVPFNNFMRSGSIVSTQQTSARMEYYANRVSEAYFDTMGIPLISGRSFTVADRTGGPPVAILNEAFARKMFGTKPAAGERIWFSDQKNGPGVEVIGVAANSKYLTMGEDQALMLYEPTGQEQTKTETNVLVRAEGDAAGVVAGVREALATLDDSAAIEVKPLRTRLAFAYLPSQIGAVLVGGLGALGLMLALIGIYGSMAFAASSRSAEMGIRMALGASAYQVLRSVFSASLGILCIGMVIGVAVSMFASTLVTAFLAEGIKPADPVMLASVILICLAVGGIAAFIPARRVLSIDPISTLRVQ